MNVRSSRWLFGAAASAALLVVGGGLAARAQDAGGDDTVTAAPPPPPPPPVASPQGTATSPATPPVPGGGPGFRRRGGGFGGTVASVTTTGFTYTARRGNQTVTVTTTPQTKYTVTRDGEMSGIKAGDMVQVMGPSDAAAKTVQAFRVNDGPAPIAGGYGRSRSGAGGSGGPGGFGGFRNFMTTGTVVSTSPLKVKDAQGVVYTVSSGSPNTTVSFSTSGSLRDVAVGKFVMVRPSSAGGPADPTSTAITADSVIVSPTAPQFGGGFGGSGRGRGFGG